MCEKAPISTLEIKKNDIKNGDYKNEIENFVQVLKIDPNFN
ncbi:MAG: hypothetical protein ACFFG0_10060 [Candidatus Thorarchaeota archaeon]